MYKLELESKKHIFLILISIVISSLFLKLYTIDFTTAEINDNWLYVLRGISFSNGFYAESPIKPSGFPLILSSLFSIIQPNDFIDYVNVSRIFNIIISSLTIFPLYFLARNFFNKKFSLLLPFFFAFQPQLNFNVGLGITEPLFIFLVILSFSFLLKKESKYGMYFSFLLIGMLFWVRFTGLLFVLPIIICHLIFHRDLKTLFLCSIVLLLIISPILVLRYEQFGNPLHFDSLTSESNNERRDNFIPSELNEYWFTLTIKNFFTAFGTMALPYLILLFPLGLITYKYISPQNKKFFISTLIFFTLTLIPLFFQFYMYTSARVLYHLYPFMMIFAIFCIIVFYDKKFNFLNHQTKNILIILLVCLIPVSSLLITSGFQGYGYGERDTIKIHEIKQYNKFLLDNIDGDLFWSKGESVRWINITMIEESNGGFKDYMIDTNIGYDVYNMSSLKKYYPTNLNLVELPSFESPANINTNTLNLFFSESEKNGIEYLSVGYRNDMKIFDEVYQNEQKFPFLEKIFDSNDNRFNKYHVKLFKIDYEKLHEVKNQI